MRQNERSVFAPLQALVDYAPTAPSSRPPMRFGPVGQEGGERRLNVLISRAKRRCEVFSSMTDDDIDPDFASTRKGVFALKLFIHFVDIAVALAVKIATQAIE